MSPNRIDFSSMNPMLDLLLVPGKKGFSTAKLAALLAGFLSGALAWFTVPWTTLRASIAPSYLFIAVNLIIFAIWNLSKKRAVKTGHLPEEENNTDPTPLSLKSKDLVASLPSAILQKTYPLDLHKISLNSPENDEEIPPAMRSESSCVTSESEEKSTATSNSGLVLSESTLMTVDPSGKEAAATVEGGVNDSLDATWNGIIRKSSTVEMSSPLQAHAPSKWPDRVSTAARGGYAMSMGNDEMDQRFEEFIQKNYDQIRLRKPLGTNQ